jgi:CrcB protein
VGMLQQGRYALAASTTGLHLFGSLALTVLGIKTGTLLWVR